MIRDSPLPILIITTLLMIVLASGVGATSSDMDNSGDMRNNMGNVVPFSEIFKKIEAGVPAEYDNIVVGGDFNLSKADLPVRQINRNGFQEAINSLGGNSKVIESPLSITNSEVIETVNLDNIIFKNSINFKNTTFRNEVSFRNTQFEKNANFDETNFYEDAYFDRTQFENNLNFKDAKLGKRSHFLKAQFNGTAYFNNVQFEGLSDFRDVKFRGQSRFDGGKFGGTAYFQDSLFVGESSFRTTKFGGLAGFWGTNFKGTLDFSGAVFNGYAYFLKSLFQDKAYFNEVEFDSNADFREAKFSGNADLSNTLFGGNADFWNAQFSEMADFSNALFAGNAYFDGSRFSDNRNYASSFRDTIFNENASFADAQLSSITDFRDSHFNKSLDFTNLRIDRLEINWDNIKNKLITDERTYVALVKNFEDMGQFEDADDCNYQYRRFKQESSEFGWSKFIDSVSWITCGYGVRPVYIIFWTIFLIIIFGLLFYWVDAIREFDHNQRKVVFSPDQDKEIRNSTVTEALYYSTVVFFGIHSAAGHWRAINHWKYVSMLEDIIGWFFIMLLVVTLGHIMIR